MDKINIYVPENISESIENDAIMFEIFKKDGMTPNKNRLLNQIISGYYEEYYNEAESAYQTIFSTLSKTCLSQKEKEQISKDILDSVVLPPAPTRKEKGRTCISLKPLTENDGIISQITSKVSSESISQIFCRILTGYCNNPINKREQIVFKENYDKIQNACSRKKSICFNTIWSPKFNHMVIPYKIVTSTEEMFNYLLCAEYNPDTEQQEARTYRLNRIKSVFGGNISESILSKTKHYLDRMIKFGPAYPINDDEESCIELNENGIKKYQKIAFGRPKFDRKESSENIHHYYFKCSKEQLLFYFRRFGNDAKVLYPESLKKQMILFFEESLSTY